MNTLKSFVRFANFLAFTLSLLIFCFPTVAMAEVITPDVCQNPKTAGNNSQPFRSIQINDGKFNVCSQGYLKEKKEIRSVKVALNPASATGTIDKIIIGIPGPEKKFSKIEFGCPSNTIKEGTDLIQTCGGPAILEAGLVEYQAQGHGFGAEPVQLKVKFSA